MASNAYLLNYNGYGSRIIKRESSLDDYMPFLVQSVQATNFWPGDGVNAELVINSAPYRQDFTGNYMIIADQGTGSMMRYFVMESEQTRGGQMRFTLRRDLVADFYDDFMAATAFIEKATLLPGDPLIYNPENMDFNQIKKNESILKDSTGCEWLVGYITRGSSGDTPEEDVTIRETMRKPALPVDLTDVIGLIGNQKQCDVTSFGLYVQAAGADEYARKYVTNFKNGLYSDFGIRDVTGVSTYPAYLNARYLGIYTPQELENDLLNLHQELEGRGTVDDILNATQNTIRLPEIAKLQKYNGKTVFNTGDNKYYHVSIDFIRDTNSSFDVNPQTPGSVYNVATTAINLYINAHQSPRPYLSTQALGTAMAINFVAHHYHIEIEEVYFGSYQTNISAGRRYLTDAPWSMFAMPISGKIRFTDTNGSYYSNASASWAIANGIAKNLGSRLVDIQRLPYCPIPWVEDDDIDLATAEEGLDYEIITLEQGDTESIEGILFWAPSSTFTINIDYEYALPSDAVGIKIENETKLLRFCSPNGAGVFEFCPAKNGGVSVIYIDCTYRPFNPYIHAAPDFKELYGGSYSDPRGLICGGDFSIASVSDAWRQYQINNKNYQESFDRQIVNMERSYDYQRKQQIFSAIAGTVAGAGIGAGAGARLGGGPAGAIAGAAIGAGASAIGGIADLAMSRQMHDEAIDYSRDQFGFQLGNIKALPQSVSKTGADNANNKHWIYIEEYGATEREEQALRDKLYYNGMTVGVIGQIGAYIREDKSYIKGQIIRIGIEDDTHLISELKNEFMKGVFV